MSKHEALVTRQTYSVDEVAALLGIGRNSAYEAVRRGDFPSIKVGNRIVVPKGPIDRMLRGDAA